MQEAGFGITFVVVYAIAFAIYGVHSWSLSISFFIASLLGSVVYLAVDYARNGKLM